MTHSLKAQPKPVCNLSKTTITTLTASALAGCGGGGDGGTSNSSSVPINTESGIAATAMGPMGISGAQAAQFLMQAEFAATAVNITQIKNSGYDAWLDEQMSLPLYQTSWDWLISKGYNRSDIGTREANYAIWNQLIAYPDGLRKRIALALSEIFVVSMSGIGGPNPSSFGPAAYWDILVVNAFGNFRTLLGQVTLSYAMGAYLSTMGNRKANAVTGTEPDENYAREVMQLFTIGLVELNIDGSPKLDSNNNPIETYTQNDIANIARVFTGWDSDLTGETLPSNPTRFRNPMRLIPSRHSTEASQFLGLNIPANTDGLTALTLTLDHLFNHANTGPFFSQQLIQRLITSNPSPQYIQRVATVFNNNGNGVRGDLKAVIKAVLLDTEARDASRFNNPSGGKLREPIVSFVQWAKTFNASSPNDAWNIGNIDSSLGQSPLNAPSVFNFFRPSHELLQSDPNASVILAPELQIINEKTIAAFGNFMRSFINSGYAPLQPDYSVENALAKDSNELIDHLNYRLAGNTLSAETLAIIRPAIASIALSRKNAITERVTAAIFLIMISPDYRVQK